MGFTAADIYEMGPSIVAYACTAARAEAVADALLDQVLAAEPKFEGKLLSPATAVHQAMAHPGPGPVVIADVQDNPGAGGSSDTTGLLRALVTSKAKGAVLGLLNDPEIASIAHGKGIGGQFEGALGGKSGPLGLTPLQARFRVEALSDQPVAYSGEMYGGGLAEIGLSTVLRILAPDTDIRVVVTSQRSQCLDLAFFTHFGIPLADQRILCVKSTVHFRADFDPIAAATINCAAPGHFPCQLEDIPYRKLRRGVRLGPSGPVHNP